MVNGLVAIMAGQLPLRRHRHKKPRIKPPRRPRRRHPMAQVGQPVQRQRQLMFLTQLRQRNLLPKQRQPLTMHRMIRPDQFPGPVLGQQNPCFFKTLPNRRQHVICAALIQAHGLADVGIFNPDRMRPRLRLLFVNRPAGEHRIPRHENGCPAALQEQGFNAVVSISGQNQGGRRANVQYVLMFLNIKRRDTKQDTRITRRMRRDKGRSMMQPQHQSANQGTPPWPESNSNSRITPSASKQGCRSESPTSTAPTTWATTPRSPCSPKPAHSSWWNTALKKAARMAQASSSPTWPPCTRANPSTRTCCASKWA